MPVSTLAELLEQVQRFAETEAIRQNLLNPGDQLIVKARIKRVKPPTKSRKGIKAKTWEENRPNILLSNEDWETVLAAPLSKGERILIGHLRSTNNEPLGTSDIEFITGFRGFDSGRMYQLNKKFTEAFVPVRILWAQKAETLETYYNRQVRLYRTK